MSPGFPLRRLQSTLGLLLLTNDSDVWYNKWAGGDKEDALAR